MKGKKKMSTETSESTRTAAWADVGTSVNTDNIEEALQKAGLDWTVEKKPITTVIDNERVTIPGSYANVTSNGDIVGVVSGSYEICQNRDAFEFANHVSKDLKFIKGGMTGNGLVYMIGELPGVSICGDSFTPHVIFQNSFNGFCGVKTAIIPLRIICQNQFNMAWREAGNTLSFRHSSGLKANMQQGARLFGEIVDYMDNFKRAAEVFATRKLTSTQASKFVDDLFPYDPESKRSKTMAENKRERFIAAINQPDNANFKGTVWGMINAFSDYLTHNDHVRGDKAEGRFTNNLFGQDKFKEFTDQLAKTMAEVV